jgi:mitochondrial fission protein ELM1
MDSTQLWTLTDGHAGNRRQADALAAALAQGATRNWALQPRPPWRWLAPHMLPGATHAFGATFRGALSQPPRLAIGCGRQGALATRLLRTRGTTTLQILDPRIDPRHWDLVIAPHHDGLSGPNVIGLHGSLNPVGDAWLASARAQHARFADLPQPRTTVLLGGPSASLSRDGGSVLVSTSRRTPADLVAAVRSRYANTPGAVWCGDADGANPYSGLLAWADRIVVSPDSVNMLSEACATEAPVFVFEPGMVSGRPRLFLDALLGSGRIRPMDTALAPFPVEPLRETTRVAALVQQRLSL